jgi:S1-C subfamily serine protease
VRRGGQLLTVSATIKDLPDVAASKVLGLTELELVTVTPAIQAQRRLTIDKGALVFNVSTSVSDLTGVEAGDVIVWINQSAIGTAEEAKRAFDRYSAGVLQMVFVRGGIAYRSLPFRIR